MVDPLIPSYVYLQLGTHMITLKYIMGKGMSKEWFMQPKTVNQNTKN